MENEVCKIVRIPTDKVVEGCIVQIDNQFVVANKNIVKSGYYNKKLKAYHLHFINKDKDFFIGDIVYHSRLDSVGLFDNTLVGYYKAGELSRVVATTNDIYGLAAPTLDFLVQYCKLNGEIDEVILGKPTVKVTIK